MNPEASSLSTPKAGRPEGAVRSAVCLLSVLVGNNKGKTLCALRLPE